MTAAKRAKLWLREQLANFPEASEAAIANRFGDVLCDRFGQTYASADQIVLDVCRELRGEATQRFDKFEWLRSVASHPSLGGSELRCAIVLFGYINADTGLAWPNQETVATGMSASGPRQARRALQGLSNAGFLERGMIAALNKSQREQIKRHGRGTFYVAKIPASVVSSPKSEPHHLRSAREAKRTAHVLSDRTPAVRSKRTHAVLLISKGTSKDQLPADAGAFPHTQFYPSNLEYVETSHLSLTVEEDTGHD